MTEEGDGGPPEYVADHIVDALVADPRVQELGLRVSVRGGTVFVSGTVSTPARREAVPAVVHEVLPACEVRNDTVVVDLSAPPESEYT